MTRTSEAPCDHHALTVLDPNTADRVRCRHCHLTIAAADLGQGPCPECLEETGQQRRDFEPVEAEPQDVRYRCEACGALFTADVQSGAP